MVKNEIILSAGAVGSPQIPFVVITIRSSFITYHQVCQKSNFTGDTCRA
jgi:hypothetical protein